MASSYSAVSGLPLFVPEYVLFSSVERERREQKKKRKRADVYAERMHK